MQNNSIEPAKNIIKNDSITLKNEDVKSTPANINQYGEQANPNEHKSQLDIELDESNLITDQINRSIAELVEKITPIVKNLKLAKEAPPVPQKELDELVPVAAKLHKHNYKLKILLSDIEIILKAMNI